MKKRRTNRELAGRVIPAMRRGTALDIAQRAFSRGEQLLPSTRDEILATQMPAPVAPKDNPTFRGWTSDEKMAFYTDGTVPERYRK